MTPQIVPQQPQQPDQTAQAVQKVFDIGAGRYDVTVSVGPSYQSKRQESVVMLMQFMQVNPAAAPFIADLVARNSDWPGAKEIADRLKKMLPPALQDDADPAAQAEQMKSQMQQLTQQHDQMAQALQQANEELKGKRLEQETKMKIAMLQEETKLAIAEITTKAQDAKVRMQLEADEMSQLHVAAHDVALQAGDQAHQQEMQQAQAQQAQQQQAGQQMHEQGMAEQQAQQAPPGE